MHACEKDMWCDVKGVWCVPSQLLSKTLDVVGEEDWVVEVGKCFGDQVPLYEGYPEEKVTHILYHQVMFICSVTGPAKTHSLPF